MKTNHLALAFAVLSNAASLFAQDHHLSPALNSLFEAERAFAKRCGEVGIRASFTEFLRTTASRFDRIR